MATNVHDLLGDRDFVLELVGAIRYKKKLGTMISTPTVLILGAGASKDYGFPAGRVFKNTICTLSSDEGFLSEIEKRGVGRVGEFLKRFCWSPYSSPDRFLEDYSIYVTAGRFCIARVLVEKEDERTLSAPHAPDQSWYELVINKLELGSDSYSDNELTLISFNYDRSFEHYLWRVINALFDQRKQIESAWNQRPKAIHVHGALGSYDPIFGNGRQYTPDFTGDSLKTAADGIRIIHEVDDQDEVFDAAEEALRGAARIYFLGFGFDSRNIDRLRIFRQPLAEGVEVAGTRRGIGEREWSKIVDREKSWITSSRAFQAQQIHEFLSERADL